MSNIREFMTGQHRHCDAIYTRAEAAADEGDWETAASEAEAFFDEMEKHLRNEEDILFPAFEKKTGMTMGPTAVMRHEHQQMRDLFAQMKEGLAQKNGEQFLGAGETLFMLIQQHNMKEEGVLYPMTDSNLGDQSDQLIAEMQNK